MLIQCYCFRSNGLKKGNKNGCDNKCGKFHPNACRDSLKDKTCIRNDCRFYHLKGTKIVSNSQSNQNYNLYTVKKEINNFVKSLPL